jgi:hypothetical protein
MQISRHWRMNPQRYRLQGVRYANGEVSLQARPQPMNDETHETTRDHQSNLPKVGLKVAS